MEVLILYALVSKWNQETHTPVMTTIPPSQHLCHSWLHPSQSQLSCLSGTEEKQTPSCQFLRLQPNQPWQRLEVGQARSCCLECGWESNNWPAQLRQDGWRWWWRAFRRGRVAGSASAARWSACSTTGSLSTQTARETITQTARETMPQTLGK